MKICERGLNFIQITGARGRVRICGWMNNCYIGSLLDSTMEEIYRGKLADKVRSHLIDGSYTDCPVDNCPWLANKTMEEHLMELDEIPKLPKELYLGYEGKCNYNCTCCSSYKNMEEAREGDWEENYAVIEERIRNIMPHLTTISANGRGELFCSPRTLQLLSEWRPIHPKEEVSVMLETNGSLFNEKNWKKIENLGQYYLSVSITVMSFEEEVYQYLSGTKLPISNLISNLHYVKSLREAGIINELEIATVLQERNFREMPEFTARCLEEFQADSVRIRPLMQGGPLDKNIAWFMDVRNPHHPYYPEYKRIMEHPVFKHPKVLLWSGSYDSERGEHPGILAEKKLADAEREHEVLGILDKILADESYIDRLKNCMEKNGVKYLSLYGVGRVGKLILRLNGEEETIPIKELYDNYKKGSFGKYPILLPKDGHYENSRDTAVLVTALARREEIERELKEYGFAGKVLFVQEGNDWL